MSAQGVQLTPHQDAPIQTTSTQANVVRRKWQDVPFCAILEMDGNAPLFTGGEFFTMFSSQFKGKKGVTLRDIHFKIEGLVDNALFCMCFATSQDGIKTLKDIRRAPNFFSFRPNASTKNVTADIRLVIPEGIGMQINPVDPGHPVLHLYVGCEKTFKGTMWMYVSYDCDSLYTAVDFPIPGA